MFGGLFTIVVNILQNLSKYKEVIISISIGLFFNLVFDAPFIYLFYKLGFPPGNGAVVCGLIAYSISSIYGISRLRNKYHISFKDIRKRFKDFILPWFVFAIFVILTERILPTNLNGRLPQIPVLGIAGVVCFGVYFYISYKSGIFTYLFDFKLTDRIPFLKKKK